MTRAGSGLVLPARYRMTRSADFGATVRHGVRAAQPDLVVHALRVGCQDQAALARQSDPKIGLVVGKAVGTAVERHRVARRLRHVAAAVVVGMHPEDHVVIRALPGSRDAPSDRLERQLRRALLQTERRRDERRGSERRPAEAAR